MSLSNLRPPKGAKHAKKRIGRGQGSGNGKTAGRGHKGAKSRSGFKHKRGFEGGQMPLHRRVPKRGFHNLFRVEYDVVNLDTLGGAVRGGRRRSRPSCCASAAWSGVEAGSRCWPAATSAKALTVQAHKFSGKAAEKIARGRRDGGGTVVGRPGGPMLADSLKNIFAVADLRKRVLFTLGLLAVYRVGGHIPTPGINPDALALLVDQAKNTMFGLYDMFSGRNLSQMTIFALGHHAVYQRVDHPAAADGRVAVPRAAVEGRRARAPQDHAVHALRHDRAEHRAVAGHRVLPRADDGRSPAGCRWSTTRAGASGS